MASNDEDNFFEDLFLKNNLPHNWAIPNSKITYKFCCEVFDKYDKIYRAELNLSEKIVMENVFKCLDSSIYFPSGEKFKNFKRKVTGAKKNCSDFVEEFYVLKKAEDIGPKCEAIGLSISTFKKIASEEYDNVTFEMKGKYTVSNCLALEIFSYTSSKGSKYQVNDKSNVLSFLSGRGRGSDSYNKNLYSPLNKLLKNVNAKKQE